MVRPAATPKLPDVRSLADEERRGGMQPEGDGKLPDEPGYPIGDGTPERTGWFSMVNPTEWWLSLCAKGSEAQDGGEEMDKVDVQKFDMTHWDARGGTVDMEALKGQECIAGLHLSAHGISTLVLLFGKDDSAVRAFYWLPRDNAAALQSQDASIRPWWWGDGLVELTPGNVTDYDRIRQRIKELGRTYHIRAIAMDRMLLGTRLYTDLGERDGFQVAPVGQGFVSMTGPVKALLALMRSGKLRHGGDPVLRAMALSADLITDCAGNLKLDHAETHGHIGGILALVMALAVAIGLALKPKTRPEPPPVPERMDLIPAGALLRVGFTMYQGVKYGDHWKHQAPDYHLNRALRHIRLCQAGNGDEDHVGHAMARILMWGQRVAEERE